MIITSSFYSASGAIRPGSYLYMLFCMDDDGPLYIKIGRSRDPYKRLDQIRTACPVKAVQLAVCPVRTIEQSRKLEKALLDATSVWRIRGEWCRLDLEDRSSFNEKWKALFREEGDYAWPLKWDMISVEEIESLAKRRRAFAFRRMKRRGSAYRDFVRDSRH